MSTSTRTGRDEARALAVRLITPTLGLRTNEDLIALAHRWDRDLGRCQPQSELGDALARALLEMHRVIDDRLAAQYRAEPLPSFARGPIGTRPSSPLLDGLAEDIPPFGNVDIWRTYLREPPPRRRRRRRPPPPPPPGPAPSRPRFRAPGPLGQNLFEDIGRRGRRPDDTVPGPISAVLPSAVSTGIEMVTNLILEITEATVGPLVGGLIMFIGVVDTFEGTRRTQARAAKAWGIRLSLMALSLIIEDLAQGPPPRVSPEQLHRFILQTRDLRQQWDNQHVAFRTVPVDELMLGSVAETARAYNDATRLSMERFTERARQARYSPSEGELRDFRRLVGRRLIESASSQLEPAD